MTTLPTRIRNARRNALPTPAEEAARELRRKRTPISPAPGITQAEAATRAGMVVMTGIWVSSASSVSLSEPPE